MWNIEVRCDCTTIESWTYWKSENKRGKRGKEKRKKVEVATAGAILPSAPGFPPDTNKPSRKSDLNL
jgi:hypothetical protein